MATSQNGWVVRTSSSGLAPLSWITGRVMPGDVFTIFDFLCKKFNATVEPIRRDQSWGWAYRVVRGGSDLSNHASATAIDLNAPSHPLGHRGTFSPDQNRAIQRILNDLDAVVRWGGDYPGRPDEMHFEINASSQRVAAVAERIRKGLSGGGGTAPTNPGGGGTAPAPTPTPEEEDMTPEQASQLARILDLVSVPGQPYGYPEATLNAVRATEERVKGVRGVLDVPGQPFSYPAATHNAVGGLVGQVAALQAAVVALAAGTGADPQAILAAAREGAQEALEGITVTVQTEASK